MLRGWLISLMLVSVISWWIYIDIKAKSHTSMVSQNNSEVLGDTSETTLIPTDTVVPETITDSPTTYPTPTTDSDPILDCTGKYNTYRVKKSICMTFVECPTGNGEGVVVFESKQSCDERWKKIGELFKQQASSYAQALSDQNKIMSEQYKINSEIDSLNNQLDYQKKISDITNTIPTTVYNPNIDFKIITPTPMPSTFSGYQGQISN